ncbi:MAG: TrkH family potassium uptake protein [Pseudomonadota bacterium]
MLHLSPALRATGASLSILACAMLVPAGADLAVDNADWQAFAGAAAVTLFVGVLLLLVAQGPKVKTINLHDGFLIANLCWLSIGCFGALPFLFAGLDVTPVEALFESVSGITTTGATVLDDIDNLPPGILLWRALLSWLGGVGIIVMALALLPVLQVGGMQLFRLEAAASEQVMPRVAELSLGIIELYLLLTLFGAAALMLAGMPLLDAVVHAMTAISTSGFSTHELSIGHFASPTMEAVLVMLMILGALPFVALLRAVRGKPLSLYRDSQMRWLLGFLLAGTLLIALWRWLELQHEAGATLWTSFFTVVSMMTGTGFRVEETADWGALPRSTLLFLMLIGGAAGSTSSGIKLFRVQIFVALALAQLRRLTRPHGMFLAHLGRRQIPETVADAVLAYFVLFTFTYMALTLLLGMTGLPLVNALSVTASALANVGPSLVDPEFARGDYSELGVGSQLVMVAGMYLGRLEILVVIVLFSRSFWRA